MRHVIAFVVVALVFASAASAAPQLPHLFYGSAEANDVDLPAGSVIVAKVGGEEKGRITTAEDGSYGGPSASDSKLLVQDDIDDGAEVSFFLNGIAAGQTASFSSGEVSALDLSWTLPEEIEFDQPVENEPVTCVPGSNISVSTDGVVVDVSCDSPASGTLNNITKAAAPTEGAISVFPGTSASDIYEISVDGNFTITVTISYDDTGLDESTITIYKFDGASWVALPSSDIISIDTDANTITFRVAPGGTPYSTFGSAPPAPAGEGAGGGGTTTGGLPPQLALAVSGPNAIAVEAGSSSVLSLVVTASNANAPGTTLTQSGAPSAWIVITPQSADIANGGSQAFSVSISPPEVQPAARITMLFTAASGSTSATKDVELTVTAPAAPAPEEAPAEGAPPGGITGLVIGATSNPAVAGIIIIAVAAVIFAFFRMRKRGAGWRYSFRK